MGLSSIGCTEMNIVPLLQNLSRLALLAGTALMLPLPAAAQSIRVKEIAAVQGVRTNQLTGYGLVVGLDGTGDQTTQMPYTSQGMANYLQQLGLTLPPGVNPQFKNIAAVLVTAELPAFAQPGQAIDVTVSSMGNAKSLRGGTLIATPLKGADGEIYALAQGNLLVGGAGASAGGSKVQINHLSAGRIPGGGQVERAVAHGNLSVSISSTPVISQPNPLSNGQTVVTEQASIQISQDKGSLIQMGPAAQLSDVVKALNSLGATPQDLLAILQAIKASGALNAELEVI